MKTDKLVMGKLQLIVGRGVINVKRLDFVGLKLLKWAVQFGVVVGVPMGLIGVGYH